MHEQSTSAPEKTHACDFCQNQMERTEDMRGVRPMGGSAVAGGELHYVTAQNLLVAG